MFNTLAKFGAIDSSPFGTKDLFVLAVVVLVGILILKFAKNLSHKALVVIGIIFVVVYLIPKFVL